MGKVLIQMAADDNTEAVSADKAVFKWPAPPAKAQEEGTEAEEAPAAPAVEEEPAAKPVFFCKCASVWLIRSTLPHTEFPVFQSERLQDVNRLLFFHVHTMPFRLPPFGGCSHIPLCPFFIHQVEF